MQSCSWACTRTGGPSPCSSSVYNVSHNTVDGTNPWSLRFGSLSGSQAYPFGALAMFNGVAGFGKSEKWSGRLIPALLVGISYGRRRLAPAGATSSSVGASMYSEGGVSAPHRSVGALPKSNRRCG